jgi:hypothetical protein
LTFELKEATTRSKGREPDGAIVVAVHLEARVYDWDLWEQVQAKFDGLRVDTTADLFEQVVGTLNDDVSRLEQQLKEARNQVVRVEKEAAEKVAGAEFELNDLRRQLEQSNKLADEFNKLCGLPLR